MRVNECGCVRKCVRVRVWSLIPNPWSSTLDPWSLILILILSLILNLWFFILDFLSFILNLWCVWEFDPWPLTLDHWSLIWILSLILDSWFLILDPWSLILDPRSLILDCSSSSSSSPKSQWHQRVAHVGACPHPSISGVSICSENIIFSCPTIWPN